MENQLFTHTFLFSLCDAAGIERQEVARRLGVSKTLVSLWTQQKRPITWDHYRALLDIACGPETIWKIAHRFRNEGPIVIPRSRRYPDIIYHRVTPNFLVYNLITLEHYHTTRVRELREAIATLTHSLAQATHVAPDIWDIPTMHRMAQQLTTHLTDIEHSTMIAPKVEKALHALRDALGPDYYEEG
jgi:transcriptional regulator with XRE-family HTH domain